MTLVGILLKLLVNLSLAGMFVWQRKYPLALMFVGMAVCDAGSLWVCLAARF